MNFTAIEFAQDPFPIWTTLKTLLKIMFQIYSHIIVVFNMTSYQIGFYQCHPTETELSEFKCINIT